MQRVKQIKKSQAEAIMVKWHKPPNGIITGGVYRLWFGEKYYIGRTRYLLLRRTSHQNELRRRFKNPDLDCGGDQDYYQKVMCYLRKHPKITEVIMEVLVLTDDDNELVVAEQKWFDRCWKDKDCLNYGFIAIPYRKERVPKLPPQPPSKERLARIENARISKAKIEAFSKLSNRQKIIELNKTISSIERQFKRKVI